MKCTNCGNEITEGSHLCGVCGMSATETNNHKIFNQSMNQQSTNQNQINNQYQGIMNQQPINSQTVFNNIPNNEDKNTYYNHANNNSDFKLENNKLNEKIVKNLKNDFILLTIINAIYVLFLIISNRFYILNFINVISIIVLIIGYKGVKEYKSYAGICGIFIGILLILTIINYDIIDSILGFFLISRAIKYNKIYNPNSKKTVLVVIISIVTYFAIAFGFSLINLYIFPPKLDCTRSNGDKVTINFYTDGISKITINDNEISFNELVKYRTNLIWAFMKADDDDSYQEKIKIYKEAVTEYEQKENGSVCK